jgi:hypothetical protein
MLELKAKALRSLLEKDVKSDKSSDSDSSSRKKTKKSSRMKKKKYRHHKSRDESSNSQSSSDSVIVLSSDEKTSGIKKKRKQYNVLYSPNREEEIYGFRDSNSEYNYNNKNQQYHAQTSLNRYQQPNVANYSYPLNINTYQPQQSFPPPLSVPTPNQIQAQMLHTFFNMMMMSSPGLMGHAQYQRNLIPQIPVANNLPIMSPQQNNNFYPNKQKKKSFTNQTQNNNRNNNVNYKNNNIKQHNFRKNKNNIDIKMSVPEKSLKIVEINLVEEDDAESKKVREASTSKNVFDIDERFLDQTTESADVDYRQLSSTSLVQSLCSSSNNSNKSHVLNKNKIIQPEIVQNILEEINRDVKEYQLKRNSLDNEKIKHDEEITESADKKENSEPESEDEEEEEEESMIDMEDLRKNLLATMNKKRSEKEKAISEQKNPEQEKQPVVIVEEAKENEKIINDEEKEKKFLRDISLLKQKLIEHEQVLSKKTKDEALRIVSNTFNNFNNNLNAFLQSRPRIAPIIITISPNDDHDEESESSSSSSSSSSSDLIKGPGESMLEQNISQFLNEAKQMVSQTHESTQKIKRKLSQDVPPTQEKIPKLHNSNQNPNFTNLNETKEAINSMEEELLKKHQQDKNEMIKSLRDKINQKRYLLNFLNIKIINRCFFLLKEFFN